MNIMTIDLEEWFHANYQQNLFEELKETQYEERVCKNTDVMLNLFDTYSVKATFFVLGFVAEKYPELLRKIHSFGHEIATHGYGHQLVYSQTEKQFEEDIQKSISVIEKAIGIQPQGYRAPSWSITKDTKWVLPVLKRNGITYDASVFPVKTFLYGIPDSPRFPFEHDVINGNLLEFPTSTAKVLGKNVPFSGGFYFRALPYSITRHFFQQFNKNGLPVVFYLHPREIDPGQPKLLNLNSRDRLIHYYGINSCLSKLTKLVQDFKFTSMGEFFGGVNSLSKVNLFNL